MGLIVLRHPQVQADGLCYGRTEVPLAPQANDQIARAVELVQDLAPDALLTSPAQRCRALAGALSARLLVPPTLDPRLQELDFGAWDGHPWTQIPRTESDPWALDPLTRTPPGGESFRDLIARIRDALKGCDTALVVTHAGPIRALQILAGQADFDTAFATPVPFAQPLALPAPR